MRKFLHQFVISLKYIRCIKNIQTRHYTRAITGDHIIELNEKTLTGRLINYLEKNISEQDRVDDTNETLDILKRSDVNRLATCDTGQILSAFSLLTNREHCKNKNDFFRILNLLDSELCIRLNQLEITDIWNVLHTYIKIIPHRIVEYKFYENAMGKLFNESSALLKNDLVQFIFYLGLQKKTTRSKYMLKKCMDLLNEEFINNLSTEEVCVICNSTFKTSTKVSNKSFLDKVVGCINDNLCILNDPAIFTTLVKTLRHNRYQNEGLLATITCTMFFNKTIDCYSFSALCHVLALYSDFLYYDDELIKIFTDKCIALLKGSRYTSKRTYLEEQPRAKDIKRLLWCLSNLNYKNLDIGSIKEVIVPNVISRMEGGELKDDFASLIEIALYLWMLDCYDPEIISCALTKNNVQYIRGKKSFTVINYKIIIIDKFQIIKKKTS